MTEKELGDVFSHNLNEFSKRFLRHTITILDRRIGPDTDFLIHTLREARETRFTIDLIKLRFDEIFRSLRQILITEERADLTQYSSLISNFGHEGIKAADLYEKEKDGIPTTETELHTRGKVLETLRDVNYAGDMGQRPHTNQVIAYYESKGLNEQAEKVRHIISLYDSGAKNYREPRNQLLHEELKKMCDHFSKPFFDPEETEHVVKQIKTRINELLDELG